MAKVYLNDVNYSNAASITLMLVASKFSEAEQIKEFIIKFITIALAMLLTVEKQKVDEKQKLKKMTMKKTREQVATEAKEADDEIYRGIKKSLIIEILRKIQSIRNDDVNDHMREMLLSTNKRNKDLYGQQNVGILVLLKYWGDSKQQADQYIKRIDDEERRIKEDHERKKKEEEDRKRKEQDQRMKEFMDKQDVRQSMQLVPVDDMTNGNLKETKDTMALVQYVHKRPTGKIGRKAQLELDKIKLDRATRNEQQRLEELAADLKLVKQKKNLAGQLERRMIEHGVGTKNIKDDQSKKIIFKDGQQREIQDTLEIVDLEQEEERDKSALSILLRKYQKLLHNLFSKYANTGFSTKQVVNFDQYGTKTGMINMPEWIKMLKDHDITHKIIKKEEISQIMRLLNLKHNSDLQSLDFDGFKNMFIQSAIVIYQLSPYESVKTLIKHFEESTRKRGQATFLYDDPDISNRNDKDIIQELTKRVQKNPEYPIPEGFKKIEEKDLVYKYEIPQYLGLGESQVQGILAMDTIVDELFGIRLIEPIASYTTTIKVRPSFKREVQQPSQNYLKAMEQKVKNRTIGGQQSIASLNTDIKPKMPTNLKILVTEQPMTERPHYQETAEALEEIIEAVCKGLLVMPARARYGVGNISNKVKEDQLKMEKDQKMIDTGKEKKRKDRHEELKKDLTKLKAEKDIQVKETRTLRIQERKKEKDILQKRQSNFDKKQDKRKADIEQKKQTDLEAIQEEKNDPNIEKKKEKNKQWLQDQKTKARGEFKDMKKQRDNIVAAEEHINELDRKTKEGLKEKFKKYNEEHKDERKKEQETRKQVNDFNEQSDVKDVHNKYDKPLRHFFAFYAAQDKKVLGTDIEDQFNTVNLKEWILFGSSNNIVSTILSPEQHKFIFRFLLRERIQQENNDNINALDYTYFLKALSHIAAIGYETFGSTNEKQYNEKQKYKEQQKQDKQKKTTEMVQKYNDQQQTRKLEDINKSKKQEQIEQERQRLKKERVSVLMTSTIGKAADGETTDKEVDDVKQMKTLTAGQLDEMKGIKNKEKNTMKGLKTKEDNYNSLNNMKIDSKNITELTDVSVITSSTIESLLQYINLETTDDRFSLDKKLMAKRSDVYGGAKPNKMKRQSILPPSKHNQLESATKIIEEVKEDDKEEEEEKQDNEQ